ncbi:hypothetical protein ACHAXA_005063 [Cyclostephanos tholiformis]|uniref:Uncharacterized protein n=1 Tax=Cyclostephanos tholiformis TaxID=382380 RepID=A0ABD3SSX5_9STRA
MKIAVVSFRCVRLCLSFEKHGERIPYLFPSARTHDNNIIMLSSATSAVAAASHSLPSKCVPALRHQYRSARPLTSSTRRIIRTIVTSSISPSPDVFIERPEVIVLSESSLYRAGNSWDDYSSTYFPRTGLHYASVDVFHSSRLDNSDHDHARSSPPPSLDELERTMAEDLSRLISDKDVDDDLTWDDSSSSSSNSAHVLLIARGPIQCLVAQYFLESSPLAGLVLVDPLLLPEDGRGPFSGTKKEGGAMSMSMGSASRWTSSIMDLISMLEGEAANPPPPRASSDGGAMTANDPPLIFRVVHDDGAVVPGARRRSSTREGEIALLRSLLTMSATAERSRPLRLEPGSVPLLVMYSGGDHDHVDMYRICAERTAAFHTCGGSGDQYDQVPVVMVPTKESERGKDDMHASMRLIYEWYDEVVA